jgi:hypothetical protein
MYCLKKPRQFVFIIIVVLSLMGVMSYTTTRITASGQTITTSHTPFISTRSHFSLANGMLLTNRTETDYDSNNNIPGLSNETCPNEIAIVVHGWGLDKNMAIERFDRAKMSLEHNNYSEPIIGFSWDANTTWTIAKSIAKDNGPKLAQFISDYKNKCQATEIRLIAHSLGSRTVLSALDALHNNQKWKSEKFKIESVHLMGAAVDNEEVSKNPSYIDKIQPILNNMTQLMNSISEWYDIYGIKSSYGKVIETEVNKFYNLFDPKDKALIRDYAKNEYDNALGLTGKEEGIIIPTNYNQTDVQDQILPLADADGDGKCDGSYLIKNERLEKGYNHACYFGFINATSKMLIADGAMDVVVSNWRNGNVVPGIENLTLPPSLSIC